MVLEGFRISRVRGHILRSDCAIGKLALIFLNISKLQYLGFLEFPHPSPVTGVLEFLVLRLSNLFQLLILYAIYLKPVVNSAHIFFIKCLEITQGELLKLAFLKVSTIRHVAIAVASHSFAHELFLGKLNLQSSRIMKHEQTRTWK